jgi:hypothetical protein
LHLNNNFKRHREKNLIELQVDKTDP